MWVMSSCLCKELEGAIHMNPKCTEPAEPHFRLIEYGWKNGVSRNAPSQIDRPNKPTIGGFEVLITEKSKSSF